MRSWPGFRAPLPVPSVAKQTKKYVSHKTIAAFLPEIGKTGSHVTSRPNLGSTRRSRLPSSNQAVFELCLPCDGSKETQAERGLISSCFKLAAGDLGMGGR